jgi:hypothetical protein
MDKGNVEFFGPSGLAYSFSLFSKVLSVFQSGFVYHYSFVMICTLMFLVSFFVMLHFELLAFYSSTFMFLLFSYFLLGLTNPK